MLKKEPQYSKLKINKCIILTKDTERKDKLIEYIPLWKWLLE